MDQSDIVIHFAKSKQRRNVGKVNLNPACLVIDHLDTTMQHKVKACDEIQKDHLLALS